MLYSTSQPCRWFVTVYIISHYASQGLSDSDGRWSPAHLLRLRSEPGIQVSPPRFPPWVVLLRAKSASQNPSRTRSQDATARRILSIFIRVLLDSDWSVLLEGWDVLYYSNTIICYISFATKSLYYTALILMLYNIFFVNDDMYCIIQRFGIYIFTNLAWYHIEIYINNIMFTGVYHVI